MAKVDIPRVIEALQESQNDPDAATRKLAAEADEREAEAEALRGVAQAIKLLTGGGASASAQAAGSSASSGGMSTETNEVPAGMEAVRRVMKSGGVWTGRAMLDELVKRGWEPKKAKHPLATVEAAMDRLFRVKEETERVGRGEYAYKGHPASPSLETLGDYAS